MEVQSLGSEDPLQEEMATHSRILAWGLPWTEESGGLQSMRSPRVGHNRSDLAHTHEKEKNDDGLVKQRTKSLQILPSS